MLLNVKQKKSKKKMGFFCRFFFFFLEGGVTLTPRSYQSKYCCYRQIHTASSSLLVAPVFLSKCFAQLTTLKYIDLDLKIQH